MHTIFVSGAAGGARSETHSSFHFLYCKHLALARIILVGLFIFLPPPLGYLRPRDRHRVAMYYQAGTPALMPTWLKLVFSMPRYVIRAMPTVHAVYVSAYYNGLGAELSLMAFFIALGRSFDALTDPFMGWITDSTRTRTTV